MTKVPFAALFRKNFRSFVDKMFVFLHGEQLQDLSGYVTYICAALNSFIDGTTRQLLVNLPARHLKTELFSIYLPAFMLGLRPNLRIMIVAFDLSIAEDIVRQIRDIMNSDWYRAVFRTRIMDDHSRKHDFATTDGGRVRAVAVGSATGKGADVIIFDDPHNALDWNDPIRKKKVLEQFSHLMSRRDAGARTRFLVVGHRVAEDDLSATIIERGDFKHICLPLFAPTNLTFTEGDSEWTLKKGAPLRPDVFPVEEIEKMRKQHMGSPFWLHFQQGLGRPDNDHEVDIGDFPIYRRPKDGLPVVISVDPALKTASQSQNVIHVYAIDGKRYILMQAWARECGFKKLRMRIESFINKYEADHVLVENTARGPDLIEALRERVDIEVEAINPRKSKTRRLQACTPIIRAKRVRILEGRDEVERAIDQVVAFPHTPYDDHVDAMTNFLIWVKSNSGKISRLQMRALRKARPGPALALGNRRAVVPKSNVRGISMARYSAPHPLAESNERSADRASSYQVQDDSVVVVYGTPSASIRRRTS